MLIRNGPLVVVIAVGLSVIAGGFGFYFSGHGLLTTLIAAAIPLFLCTLFVNFVYARFHSQRALPERAPAVPAPSTDCAEVAPAVPVARRGILRSAFFYLTIGSLTVIWSGLWYWYLSRNPPARDSIWYVCEGLILTGLLLMAVGGWIFRLGHPTQVPRNAAPTS